MNRENTADSNRQAEKSISGYKPKDLIGESVEISYSRSYVSKHPTHRSNSFPTRNKEMGDEKSYSNDRRGKKLIRYKN